MTSRSGSARSRRPLARLLLDAVDDDARGVMPSDGYAGVTADTLVKALFMHKVGPAVYRHLRECEGADPALVAVARDKYREQVARQLQVTSDLTGLIEVLRDLGVAWATVKGPVLAERLWTLPDLRQYADFDVVVDRRRLADVVDALLANGAELIDRNWVAMYERAQGEMSLRLAHGTSLDLHWHLVNNAALRPVFRFPMDEILARTTPVQVCGAVVPTMDDVDTLLHLAYHTAHSGGHRLMWLKDVECAAAVPALDWDVVVQRATAYGVLLSLGLVLARAERTVGLRAQPPAAVRRAIRSAWSRAAGLGDRMWSAPALPSDRMTGQIMYKSTRDTGAASLRSVLHAATHRPPHKGPNTDNVLHQAVGGADERARFFERVGAGGAS